MEGLITDNLNRIPVLLVDDSSAFLESTMKTLKRNPVFEIVDVAFNAEDAITAAEKHQPMVILLDGEMPGVSRLEITQTLTEKVPGTKVIILTLFNNYDYCRSVDLAGVAAFIAKSQIVRDLIPTIMKSFMPDSPIKDLNGQK